MSRHKERIFSYPRYCPFEVIELNPKRITPSQCREILGSHVGKNSTFFIEASTRTTDIIRPQALFDAKKLDPENQQNFLDTKAGSIKDARRVFIKTSTLRLHKN